VTDELTVTYGGHRHHFPPGEPVVVGRAAECQVVVLDTRVSRHHLEIGHDGNGWLVRDLDSGNGTWQGQTRLERLRVRGTVAVRLGQPDEGPLVELSVRLPARTDPPPLPPETADLSSALLTGDLPDDLTLAPEPIPLRDGLTLGRDTDNDVVLADLLVSRRHVRLVRAGADYRVEDLGSANRTFVNGDAVVSSAGGATLGDGDTLTVGRTRLTRSGNWLCPQPTESESGLVAEDLRYALPGGRTLTGGVSLRLRGPSLLAVIGPSGSGKSTLLRLLAGELPASGGRVRYQDTDVAASAEIRTRIGVIPQHTVAHRRLSAWHALRYAAELRLPQDLVAADRDQRVREVLTELGLAEHAETRVDRLSGGQLRRLSIGFELLTRPSLLLVDEPTAGLDPGLVRHVMRLLRQLADGGRQIIVTTHDLAHLELCDAVLVLAPGGTEAYYGPPEGIKKRFGTSDWADIFERLSAAPTGEVTEAPVGRPTPERPLLPDPRDPAVRSRVVHQASVLIRRQLRLLMADLPYAAFLTLLPVVLAAFALAVPGGEGLGTPADPSSVEAMRLLVVLLIGAAFMGMSAPVRDLVGERPIYRHECAAGLLPESYLMAKLAVFSGVALVQSVALVMLVRLLRAGPSEAVLLGAPTLEILVAVAATAIVCAALGVAVSALVSSAEQANPPLVVGVMAQLVLCGGLIPVTGRVPLEQLSWLAPARWGYAAAASTVRLRTSQPDVLWEHRPLIWLGALLALSFLGSGYAVLALRSLRRR
jgi:ABC-type multidrug transport system ATPase subunit/pSer/pThr/pTyr-binding forkhead associated (FHA) protein